MRVSQALTGQERLELTAKKALTDIADELGKLGYPGRTVALEAEVQRDNFGNLSMWVFAKDHWNGEPVSLDTGGNGNVGVPKEAKRVSLNKEVDAAWEAKDVKRALVRNAELAKKVEA